MPCVCARLEFVMEFVERASALAGRCADVHIEYARVQYRYISREL